MTQEEANIRLVERHNIYFEINSTVNRYTRYAAVIKESNDYSINNDFKIEIGFNTGETWIDGIKFNQLEIQSKIEFIKKLGFNQIIIDDYNNGELEPILTSNISYQTKKTCNEVYETIYSESKRKHKLLTGGISVFNENYYNSFGTIGAFFKITKDTSIYLISNYHVLLGSKGKIGENIVHPSVSDASYCSTNADIIGEIVWKRDIERDKFNTIDVAIAKINEGIKIDTGKYSRCEQIKYKKLGKAKIGLNIRKCGRTTGLTFGEIRSINCTVNISNDKNEIDLYKNQILTTKMTEDGDSGSIMVDDNDNVIGLFFGGNNVDLSVANHIANITNAIEEDIPDFKINKFI